MEDKNKNAFDWKAILGLVVVANVFYIKGWVWGVLSLLALVVILGWNKRHDGPFKTNKDE